MSLQSQARDYRESFNSALDVPVEQLWASLETLEAMNAPPALCLVENASITRLLALGRLARHAADQGVFVVAAEQNYRDHEYLRGQEEHSALVRFRDLARDPDRQGRILLVLPKIETPLTIAVALLEGLSSWRGAYVCAGAQTVVGAGFDKKWMPHHFPLMWNEHAFHGRYSAAVQERMSTA